MGAILEFYKKGDRDDVRSLLLCLDWYLDPYYCHDLAYQDKIFSWLEDEFYKVDDPKIKKEIFELVVDYSDIELQGYELDRRRNLVEKAGD
jgi:hypothetical protein